MKFRIKQKTYKDGSSSYHIQMRVFWMWSDMVRTCSSFSNVFNDLASAQDELSRLRDARVVSTKIFNN